MDNRTLYIDNRATSISCYYGQSYDKSNDSKCKLSLEDVNHTYDIRKFNHVSYGKVR